jgi:hypothetical protein
VSYPWSQQQQQLPQKSLSDRNPEILGGFVPLLYMERKVKANI